MNPIYLLLFVPFALALGWSLYKAISTGIEAERKAVAEEDE